MTARRCGLEHMLATLCQGTSAELGDETAIFCMDTVIPDPWLRALLQLTRTSQVARLHVLPDRWSQRDCFYTLTALALAPYSLAPRDIVVRKQ